MASDQTSRMPTTDLDLRAVAAHVRDGGLNWPQVVALERTLSDAEQEIAAAILDGDLDLARRLADEHTARIGATPWPTSLYE